MTVLSKPLNNKVAERIQHHVRSFPPPISFNKSKRAKEKKESSDYWEFVMLLDPADDKSQKTKKSCLVFEDGDPEMWCEWRRQVDDLCRLMGIDEDDADKRERIILALLRGKALESFQTYKAAQTAANALRATTAKWDNNRLLLHTLNDMALEIFPSKHSYHHQVFYMKYHLFIGDGISVKEFENRVNWMNQSLKYFPLIKLRNGQFKICKALEEDQLCDILNIAKKPEWTGDSLL